MPCSRPNGVVGATSKESVLRGRDVLQTFGDFRVNHGASNLRRTAATLSLPSPGAWLVTDLRRKLARNGTPRSWPAAFGFGQLRSADDPGRQRNARSSVATQIEGEIDGDRLADRIVTIMRLAEELDRITLEAAARIVPPRWWETRLGTTFPAELRTVTNPGPGL